MTAPDPPAAPPTLYIIDGYAALFRAYYAIRKTLYSPVTGEPTQAVMVFAGMLLKLYDLVQPGDAVVVAWDAPGKTFRDALYAGYHAPDREGAPDAPVVAAGEAAGPADATLSTTGTGDTGEGEPVSPPVLLPSYKGTRRETPDSLHDQVPRIREMLDLFGIPVIGKPGLEADDVMATLTGRVLSDPACANVRVRLVTRDKDMEQLLGDRVTLFDVHTGEERDERDLWERRGITPDQVVDYLALTGDTVDNIPGVPGIGPKTASRLLQKFGSIDTLLNTPPDADTNKATQTARQSLWEAQAQLRLSRRLVALHRDPDLPFALADARARPLADIAGEMVRFCDALGFTTLKNQCLRRLPKSKTGEAKG